METETEDDFFKRGRQLARALDRGEPLPAEFGAQIERAAQDNPELPVNFVADSLASLLEPREQATPFVPRNPPDGRSNRQELLQKLIRQVELIITESGAPQGFNAAQWVVQWLEQPLPALGNAKPADYMDTTEGRERVAGLLARMQSSAFS